MDKQIAIIEGLSETIGKSIRRSITDYDFMLLEYVQTQQLRKQGEDGKGKKLGQYREGYARIRVSRNLQVDHIDLRFTGKMFASMKVKATDKDFRISVNVPYEKDVIGRFGIDILEVQRENMIEFSEKILKRNIKRDVNDEFSRARS